MKDEKKRANGRPVSKRSGGALQRELPARSVRTIDIICTYVQIFTVILHPSLPSSSFFEVILTSGRQDVVF
jgi:hypothetical protein